MFYATLITMSRKYFFGFFLKYHFRFENFLSQNILKVFLETTLVHVSCYPDHYEPKIFFRFSKLATTLRYTILDSRFPLKMRSQKAGLLFTTRARKQELSIQEVRIENDLDRKFSKSKFVKVFLKTTFLHDSCYPVHYKPNFFFQNW